MNNLKVIWLNGMPRSGTSWLSQIFDSHPDVRFRLAPLFSYRFKDYLSEESGARECSNFISKVYASSGDEFMEQLNMKRQGHYPVFKEKKEPPGHLVMKHTRYHNLTEMVLKNIPDLTLIHIIRNPCAAINSWLHAPKECPQEDDPLTFWRNGQNRKGSKEEFWGFNDWIKLTRFYLDLAKKSPEKILVTRFENLVQETSQTVQSMFSFCELGSIPEQTMHFLKDSTSLQSDNEYSVYRGQNNVLNKWRETLPEEIQNEIYCELVGTDLEDFLNY